MRFMAGLVLALYFGVSLADLFILVSPVEQVRKPCSATAKKARLDPT